VPESPVSTSTGAQIASADAQLAPAGAHQVDVQRLAEKVYNLLLADARLGRARGDSPLVRRRNGEG